MQPVTSAIAATLLAASPALADFMIFAGQENQLPDPAATSLMLFFNNPPSCDDAVNAQMNVPNFYNDASNGGIACDGCDGSKNVRDWDVTRLEVYDKPNNLFENAGGAGDEPHLTFYKDEENGGWGIYDTDMNQYGTCSKPDDPQTFACADVFSSDSGVNMMNCQTDITIKDSN